MVVVFVVGVVVVSRIIKLTRPQVGEKKLDAYLKYAQLYPEFSFCFFGDNGQG